MSRTLSIKQKIDQIRKEKAFFHRHAFGMMNFSQALSVFNDNFFKFLTIYFLIDIKGISAHTDVLFWISVFYVLPFLLFSSFAGMLSDKLSKSRLFISFKALELVILLIALIAYTGKIIPLSYFCVFMLSLQSALISPPKYSMIPELVKENFIARANGFLTSASYLAIILGTFTAPFVTKLCDKNFIACLFVAIGISVVGFISSLLIPFIEARRSPGKTHPLFFVQTYRTFKASRKTPKLALTIVGSAFFLFVGAFLQLNVIPFAIERLHLNDVDGSLLFVGTSVGIAFGAMIAGRMCKKEIDLGLALFGILALAILLILSPLIMTTITGAAITLGLLGVFGGIFVVPLESFIQTHSPSEIRGQIIATENFLSFTGVLLAPLCLFLFAKVLHVSALSGFVLLGVFIVTFFAFTMKQLSSSFFHFLSLRFMQPLYRLHYMNYPFTATHEEDKVALTFKEGKWFDVFLLMGETSKVHLVYIKENKGRWDRLLSFFGAIDIIYEHHLVTAKLKDILPKNCKPYLIFDTTRLFYLFDHHGHFSVLEEQMHFTLKQVDLKMLSHSRSLWKRLFKRLELTYKFSPLRKTFASAPVKKPEYAMKR